MNPALRFKIHLDLKVANYMKTLYSKKIPQSTLSKILLYGVNKDDGNIHLRLPYKAFKKLFPECSKEDFQDFLKLPCDDIVSNVETSCLGSENEPQIIFNIDQKMLISNVLLDKNDQPDYIEHSTRKQNIVIDYSSPNIAKPFHFGHLRSTIIGNFISNLYEYMGHRVTRLTYLGDWGTQFGVLQIGIEGLRVTDADLKASPMVELYNAYVEGNRIVEANRGMEEHARRIFTSLELGEDKKMLDHWNIVREATVKELTKTYSRLGVKFDEYHWESSYNAKAIEPVLKLMEDKGILEEDLDGKKVTSLENGAAVPLLKSDGTTLYLTRDVAAAMDRRATYKCDRMLYVVDNSQNQHFTALKQILHKLDCDWAEGIEHVKFGRLQGLSTRRGRVVFLEDILDEAKMRMADKQQQSATTKNFSDEVSDNLGVSAIIVNDLKQRRMKDYTFDWNSALQMDGDTGVKLQYTHCRLTSLERGCGVSLPDLCDPGLLCEPEALALVLEIARMEEAVERANSKLEAHEVVNYLFKLCNKTSQALKTLNVKHQSADVAEQRLLLFHRARTVLHSGMRLLGLQPLSEM